MKSLGYTATKEEVARVFDNIDEDGSGMIEYDEFYRLLKSKMREKLVREEMMKCFLLFDTAEKGGITFKDLRRAVQDAREDISDIEIHGMMEEADKDSDGIVTVDDFVGFVIIQDSSVEKEQYLVNV